MTGWKRPWRSGRHESIDDQFGMRDSEYGADMYLTLRNSKIIKAQEINMEDVEWTYCYFLQIRILQKVE